MMKENRERERETEREREEEEEEKENRERDSVKRENIKNGERETWAQFHQHIYVQLLRT